MYQEQLGKRGETARIDVSVTEYGGKLVVDLRRFFQLPTGAWHPTKKGVSLSPEEWEKLKASVYNIDHAIQQHSHSAAKEWSFYSPAHVHGEGVAGNIQSPFGSSNPKSNH